MLKIDLHLHTIASGHAYNTILEYINQAKKLKMKIIGISEHGPAGDIFISEIYFKVLYRIPRVIDGIMILRGAEANIINKKGALDISDKTIKKLDYVIAGFHEGTPYKNLGRENNTNTIINCIKSHKVNIISHPFKMDVYDIDIKKVSQTACDYGVLLEINTHYIDDHKIKPNTIENLIKMVEVVKKNNKKIIVNSDAHNIWELGDDRALKKIKNKIGLIDKLIINNYPKELLKLLKIKL